MKTKSYALKPWWPRTPGSQPLPTAGATLPDRLSLFRHQVALAAQLLDVSADTQDRLVAAVDQILTTSVPPDIASQAEQPELENAGYLAGARKIKRTMIIRSALPR